MWLGLDGILSPKVAHNMGAAYMLYAQGLLPFLLPLSVLLFEADVKSRRRMLPFLVLGGATTLYIVGVDGVPIPGLRPGKQHRVHQSSHKQYRGRSAVCDCNVRFTLFVEGQAYGDFRRCEPRDPPWRNGIQAICVHFAVVCVRGDRKSDYPRLLLAQQRRPAVPLRAFYVRAHADPAGVGVKTTINRSLWSRLGNGPNRGHG